MASSLPRPASSIVPGRRRRSAPAPRSARADAARDSGSGRRSSYRRELRQGSSLACRRTRPGSQTRMLVGLQGTDVRPRDVGEPAHAAHARAQRRQPQLDRRGVRIQSFQPRQRRWPSGPSSRRPSRRELLHRDAAREIHAPTARCRRAHSRRWAARDWCRSSNRPSARATSCRGTPSRRCASRSSSARGSRVCEDQVLGRIAVATSMARRPGPARSGCASWRIDCSQDRAARQRRASARVPPRRPAAPASALVVTSMRLRLRIVLGLRQQVRGDEIGARAVIGDHQHFGGARGQVERGAVPDRRRPAAWPR